MKYGTLTRSIDIDEAIMLITLSTEIKKVSEWQEEALYRLPQSSRNRRLSITRTIRNKFLEVENDTFVDGPFAHLIAAPLVEPRLKRDLILGQYLRSTPLVWESIREVVLPHLESTAIDENEVQQNDWDTFLETRLVEHTETTFSRTRRHITAHLSKFGILEAQPIPGRNIGKRFFPHFYDPDPRAFWFYLATEFSEQGWTSRSLAYITKQSWTRIAFCTSETYARYAVEEAERSALMVTNFFGSEKQITLRGPDPLQRITEAIQYG
ncbi:MAG: hypothetical protein JW908_09105 [Anaerolineales bacterium]|nr:hypothetical protein [Anaerolineales bacterium]